MELLLKSVEIIDRPTDLHQKRRNVLIKNGTIAAITSKKISAAKTLDAKNLKLSLGWCDMRAHFCDPGLESKEDLETGRLAAQAGGFTDVVLMPNTNPVVETKNEVSYLTSGNPHHLTQLHVIGAVTRGTQGEELTEMIDLKHAGAVAFSDGIEPLWHTDVFGKALQYLRKFDGLLINRAEDRLLSAFGQMNEGVQSTALGVRGIPKLSEELMVARDLALLEYYGGRLHFANVSSEGSLSLIKAARKKDLKVTCDVAAHQLTWDDSLLNNFDTNYKVNPPLRESGTVKALIKGLKEGVIDVLVSDHRPEDEEGKKLEFDQAAFGMIGIQEMGAMIHQLSGQMDLGLLLEKITYAPRRLLGLEQPELKVGSKAVLTLYDPHRKWRFDETTNCSKSRNSPNFSKELTGKAVAVFNNGKVWFDQKRLS